jgi:preprotein translocase subunit SecB
MADDKQAVPQTEAKEKILQTRKIYIKDASFESPNAPAIFTTNWDPALDVDVDHEISALSDNTYDVVITVTARAVVQDTTAFLVEVQQGGVFIIKGLAEDQLQQRLNVGCLRTLYPYACAAVDSLLVKGGFPPIHLGPINFAARYQQILEQDAARDNDEEAE